jgi:hypothetical protein
MRLRCSRDDVLVASERRTAWQRAKADWPGLRRQRELVTAIIGAGLGVGALLALGFSGSVIRAAVIVAVAAIGAAILVPPAELVWALVRAPARLLADDVAAIRRGIEALAAPAAAGVSRATDDLQSTDMQVLAAAQKCRTEIVLNRDRIGEGLRDHLYWSYQLGQDWLKEYGDPLLQRPSVYKLVADAHALLFRWNSKIVMDDGWGGTDIQVADRSRLAQDHATLNTTVSALDEFIDELDPAK